MSARRPSTPPSVMPSDSAKASSTTGRFCCSTFFSVTRKSASGARHVRSRGSRPGTSAEGVLTRRLHAAHGLLEGRACGLRPAGTGSPLALPPSKRSPSILPSKSMVTRSPSVVSAGSALGEGATLLAQDVEGRSIAASLTSALALDLDGGQVADDDFRIRPRRWRRTADGLRRRLPSRRCAGAGHTDLAPRQRPARSGADLVVHHFVLDRVAVTLGHDIHRHLARTESVGLDRAGQFFRRVSTSFLISSADRVRVMRRSSLSRVSTVTAMF